MFLNKVPVCIAKCMVPRGLMDMASDYESGDSGFESRRGSFKLPVRELFLKCYPRCIITMYL